VNSAFVVISPAILCDVLCQLVIGDYGLSLDQQRLQMSLWSIMAAPLFVSTDLRTLKRDSQDILLNSLVLSINQDQLGKLGLEIQRVSTIDILLILALMHF